MFTWTSSPLFLTFFAFFGTSQKTWVSCSEAIKAGTMNHTKCAITTLHNCPLPKLLCLSRNGHLQCKLCRMACTNSQRTMAWLQWMTQHPKVGTRHLFHCYSLNSNILYLSALGLSPNKPHSYGKHWTLMGSNATI